MQLCEDDIRCSSAKSVFLHRRTRLKLLDGLDLHSGPPISGVFVCAVIQLSRDRSLRRAVPFLGTEHIQNRDYLLVSVVFYIFEAS